MHARFMTHARLVVPLITLFVLVAVTPTSQAALRCGSSLVSEGDWPVEVEERCGKPDYVATYPTATLPGLGVVQSEEHWYYNPGPQRFIRRLVFRNGSLVRIDSLGYGFTVSVNPRCDLGTLRSATNEYELMARCGPPVSKRTEWQVAPTESGHYGSQAALPVLIQEWLYDLASNQFRKVVTLRNGEVVDIESRPAK
ncbi:DUF2845 domain-containing protein [Marinobacter sp. C2H3]|uniref:DUF2845 domain-containing protein n=1 Tax=Marinobacter sp. C2H3 TaxID=3119003 RepID=UPI00300E7B13